MEENGKKDITFLQKVTLVTVATLFALILVLGLGVFIPYGNGNLTRVIVLRGWQLKNQVFGESEIGIFQADPVFGWRPKARSSGKHYQPYGFSVRYHIDEEGHRVTPGTYDRPMVLFLGGSFTFGHGVEDDENFVYQLGEMFPDYKMVNQAVMAWGTSHAYLQLQESFEKYGKPKAVVYGFITSHLPRNYLRRDWLELVESWGRKNPYFELENGQPVYQGLANAATDGIPNDEQCHLKEKAVTRALIRSMKSYCDEQGVPFLVVYIPDQVEGDFREEIIDAVGQDHFIDLRENIVYEEYKLEGDAHPSPQGHLQIVKYLAPAVRKMLEKQDSFPEAGGELSGNETIE